MRIFNYFLYTVFVLRFCTAFRCNFSFGFYYVLFRKFCSKSRCKFTVIFSLHQVLWLPSIPILFHIFIFKPIKKLLTKFYTIFGITTSCLLTDMKIRKIEEHFWSRNPLRSPSRIKTHLHDKGKRPNFFGWFPVKIWNLNFRSWMKQ